MSYYYYYYIYIYIKRKKTHPQCAQKWVVKISPLNGVGCLWFTTLNIMFLINRYTLSPQ